VFEYVEVDSVFEEGGALYRRQFKFQLTDTEQVKELLFEKLASPTDVRTRISFRGFHSQFANRCPSRPGTIALRILSHFIPLFVGGNAPKVVIEDRESIDIEALFADSIVEERTEKVVVELGDENPEVTIWSLRCHKTVRFDGGGFNFSFLTGNNRSVIDYSIACASAEFLDEHVNSERTGFTLDGKEIDAVKRAVAKTAREFLRPYIEMALAQKVAVTREVITENPQFLYVEPQVKAFAETLQPNLFKKEDIFVELSRSRFRRQRSFASLEQEIVKSKIIDEALQQKVEEYRTFVTDEKRGELAEYVTRRKAVIDLFEKFLEYKDDEKQNHQREDAIHRLICPMRVDSTTLEISDHNLWLLDDRLAFYHFFASDKEIRSYTGIDE
jgi:hypothetical protein